MRAVAARAKYRNRLLTGIMAICALMALAIVPNLSRLASASASGSATWILDGGPAALGEQGTNAASCPSAAYCIELPPNQYDLNTYIWSSGSWTTASLVNPGGMLQMNSISCVSASFCMAGGRLANQVLVGHLEQYEPFGLVETWNGSSWTEIDNPEAEVTGSTVTAVSCTSTTSCVIVGNAGSDGAFAMAWNGSSWVGELSDPGYSLSSVSCASTTSCVAIGTGPTGLEYSFVLSDGTWTGVAAVNPGDQNYLYSVSCASASFCVAAGSASFPGIGWGLTLIEIWNGTSWSVSSSPNPPVDPDSPAGAGGILMSVSCVSAAACVAVGYGQPISGADANGLGYPVQAIVETWDGTGWSITPTPAPIDPDGEPGVALYGDACAPSAGDASCIAVGSQNTGASSTTAMVLESSAAIGSLSPTSTQLDTSGSQQLTVTVSPAELASPRNDSVLQTGAGDPPTGSVTFLNDGAAIADCPPVELNAADQAACAATGLSGPFTAVYSGDGTYNGSAGGTDDGPPPTTTTTTTVPDATTTTTTVPDTTTTVPDTTTTVPGSTTTTTTTVPGSTTTVPSSTTTTTATVADTATTTTFPSASGVSPAASSDTATVSTAWLRSRIVSVNKMGAISTAVTTLQPGVATVTASYEVKETAVVRHRVTSRTVTKVFDSIRASVPRGTTMLVLQPTAPALGALREYGALDLVVHVTFHATGSETASQTWRIQDRFRP